MPYDRIASKHVQRVVGVELVRLLLSSIRRFVLPRCPMLDHTTERSFEERLSVLIKKLGLDPVRIFRFVGKDDLVNIVTRDEDRNVVSVFKGILNISRATLDRWRKLPGFPGSNNRKGCRCLFWLPDVLNWMAHRPDLIDLL